MTHDSTLPPFSSATEAIAASTEDPSRLVQVVHGHENWAHLFEQCEFLRGWPDGSRIFVARGWCVWLLPRVRKVSK
jgi:hypothetical protein